MFKASAVHHHLYLGGDKGRFRKLHLFFMFSQLPLHLKEDEPISNRFSNDLKEAIVTSNYPWGVSSFHTAMDIVSLVVKGHGGPGHIAGAGNSYW